MDRRQKKTREAIYNAFSSLLEEKPYSAITVQEIIDAADVGRSTFYAHFETKDELLRSLCTDIFDHVFLHALPQESSSGYTSGSSNLELKLGHVLYHLRDTKQRIRGLLRSESGELFLSYFKEYLSQLFSRYLEDFDVEVPRDYLLHHLVGSFSETVRWWIAEDTRHSPEQVAGYFMAVLQK